MKIILLLLTLLSCGVHIRAQIKAFSLPTTAEAFQQRGIFAQYIFFSSERTEDQTNQLWQFDTQTGMFTERSSGVTFLVDFTSTPQGVFWIEKERRNRFGAGRVTLWFWSGQKEASTVELYTANADQVRFLQHSDTQIFLLVDIAILAVNAQTLAVQNLGSAPPPNPNLPGVIWQGQYFWSVSDGAQNHRVYRAGPQLGVEFFWRAAETVYNFVPLGKRLLWREGDQLLRYEGGDSAPQYYYQFDDWDEQNRLYGAWSGASLRDSLFLFPAPTLTYGSELWRTDGTAEGTFLLKDIAPEATGKVVPSSFPDYLHESAGKIHFLAYTNIPGSQEHWVSDGTREGTVRRSAGLAFEENINYRTRVNDSLFLFHVQTREHGLEPVLFSNELHFYDLHTGGANSVGLVDRSRSLGLSDGSIAMEAFTAEQGREAWIISAGQGPVRLPVIAAQRAWSYTTFLGEVDNLLYLLGGNIDLGYQLYAVDPEMTEEPSAPPHPVRWQQSITPALRDDASGRWVYSLGLVRGTDGSLYSSGSVNFSANRIRFSQGKQPLSTAEHHGDGYLTRLDQAGHTEWLLALPGSYVTADAPFISEAPDHGVYVGGRYVVSSQIGSTTIPSGAGDVYLARINDQGEELWVKTLSLGGGQIFRLRTDAQGYLWVLGNYRNQARLGEVILSSGINPTYFVARYTPDGTLVWATSLEPELYWPSGGPTYAADFDAAGNLWLVLNNIGHNYNVPCNFGAIYGRLVKVSPAGTVLLEREWSGNDAWYAIDLSITARGNVLLAGRFRGKLEFDRLTLQHTGVNCSSAGFVVKIDPFGTLISARKIEGNRIPEALVANADGTYTLAGYQQLPQPFSYPGYTHDPFGSKDQQLFTAVYSSTDALLAERTFLGEEEFDRGGFIFLLPGTEKDEWILQTELEGMLDTFGVVAPSWQIRHHVHMLSVDLPYQLPPAQADQQLTTDDILLAPNPATDLVIVQSEDTDFMQANITLYNIRGQNLGRSLQQLEPHLFRLRLSGLPAGVYQLVIQTEDETITKPIFKLQ